MGVGSTWVRGGRGDVQVWTWMRDGRGGVRADMGEGWEGMGSGRLTDDWPCEVA